MSEQRVKGQEVETLLVVDGAVQDTITDTRSLEVTFKTEILEEGYLGETTQRFDEIFKGISGRIEYHFENQDVFLMIQKIIDRARRRTPGTKVNIKATLNMPNGQRPRVQINDCSFGPFPVSFGSRQDYGSITMEFAASEARVLTT